MEKHEIICIGQLEIRYLKDGSSKKETGAFELTVPPKSNVPPAHSHIYSEEFIYVLEGTLRYSVDAKSRDLRVGESMFTSKGAVHGFSNPFDVSAKALVVLSPDIGAGYFRDISAIGSIGGPPDRAKIFQVMSKYGLVPAAPNI